MKNCFLLLLLLSISISGFSQKPMTEEKAREYFIKNKDSLDAIEGIWQVAASQEYYRYDTLIDDMQIAKAARIAVIKEGAVFKSYSLKDESAKIEFRVTDVKDVYLYQIYFPETNEYSKSKAVLSKQGEMEYQYEFPDQYLRRKLGDAYEEGTRVLNKAKWTKVFPDTKVK